MAKYFTLSELTRSNAAVARGIDNTPPPEVRARLAALMEKLLDPIREMWGRPIAVNSGYRCPLLNKLLGGAAASQHMRGEAADITTGTAAGNKQLFEMLVAARARGEISFDQLIDERGYAWLHLSYRAGNNRNQILHL